MSYVICLKQIFRNQAPKSGTMRCWRKSGNIIWWSNQAINDRYNKSPWDDLSSRGFLVYSRRRYADSDADGDGEGEWVGGAIGVDAVSCVEEIVQTWLSIESDDWCQTIFQADAQAYRPLYRRIQLQSFCGDQIAVDGCLFLASASYWQFHHGLCWGIDCPAIGLYRIPCCPYWDP